MEQLAAPFYSVKAVSSWRELVALYDGTDWPMWEWAYRGHRAARWDLRTSLEQCLRRTSDQAQWPEALNVEYQLVREFKRQAQHYLTALPEPHNTLEWLSIMEHYGAPTRLLDWTYSFYVAVFFAIEHVWPGNTCAIWVINIDWLDQKVAATLASPWRERWANNKRCKRPQLHQEFFAEPREMVFPVNPFRLDKRLVIQQGVFLAPGDVSKPFMQNLCSVDHLDVVRKNICKIEVQVTAELLRDAYLALGSMNINEGTLFPGLDGFSRSLRAMPFVFDPTRCARANAFTDLTDD